MGVFDSNFGSPNMAALQYIQENWGKDEISAAVRVEKVSVTSSGTSGVEATNIPVGAEIMDVVVQCTATVGSGTAQVQDGDDNAITDAITCATLDAVTRASTIDQTYKVVGSSGIKVVTHSDSDMGDVYIYYRKSR